MVYRHNRLYYLIGLAVGLANKRSSIFQFSMKSGHWPKPARWLCRVKEQAHNHTDPIYVSFPCTQPSSLQRRIRQCFRYLDGSQSLKLQGVKVKDHTKQDKQQQ
jgi:hypothetical protein